MGNINSEPNLRYAEKSMIIGSFGGTMKENKIVAPQPEQVRSLLKYDTNREQEEAAMQESETHFPDPYDNVPIAYFSIRASDGLILRCNAAAHRLFGYSKESLTSLKVLDLCPDDPERLGATKKIIKRITSGESIKDVELQLKHGDGRLKWINLSTEPVKNASGDIAKIRAVAMDISDRKRTEKARRSQRDILMNILDSMADGVYIINQEYDIEYANPPLVKEFGPFAGKKCYNYLANRDTVCPHCKNKEVFAGKTVHWQWFSPKNKKTYDLMDTPLKNPDGSIWKLEIFRDITEYKRVERELVKARDELEQRVAQRTTELEKINQRLRQQVVDCELAESALRDSEQKYSTLVEDALIGVYIIQSGKIVFANDKFAEIYGYPKSELIGMESLKLVHPEDRPLVREMRTKRLRGEKVPSEYEIRSLKKTGETIWVMRSYSLINYDGKPAISGIVSDMTKRRKAEDALRKSDRELRILSNQLLSTEEKERKRIARELHDGIGQALSAIKFGVENSLRELRNTVEPSEIKSLQTLIPLTQKTIEEVRSIVKDLRPAILDDLGILATITWFCREFQKVYTSIQIVSNIYIEEKDIPAPLKTVIYRILQEALNNIAKHSQASSVQLDLRKTDNRIDLEIDDNGIGFDLDEVMALKPSQRGFGLASMRERAELSEATFAIDSKSGQGTTIRVRWSI